MKKARNRAGAAEEEATTRAAMEKRRYRLYAYPAGAGEGQGGCGGIGPRGTGAPTPPDGGVKNMVWGGDIVA